MKKITFLSLLDNMIQIIEAEYALKKTAVPAVFSLYIV